MAQHLQVFRRVHAESHCPEQGIGIVRIDVVVDRNADLAAVRLERSRAVQRAPYLGARRAFRDRDDRDAAQGRHALVHGHARHTFDPKRPVQVREKHRLVGDALDRTRFARRDLAQVGRDHGIPAVGDRRHAHRHVELFQRNVPVRLAEWALGLESSGVDQPFDHDLSFGRHQQVDRFGAHDLYRRTGKTARDAHLVEIERQLLRRHERDTRRRAQHDRAGHERVAALLMLQIMLIASGAADARRHTNDQTVRGFEARTISAVIVDAGVRIAGDHVGRRQCRGAIEARGGDGDRQRIQPVAFAFERVAHDDDVLTCRLLHNARRYRIRDRLLPAWLHFFRRCVHAEAVNAPVARERADDDRILVAPAFGIDDVREQERFALMLFDAAHILPAHERMKLGILVDWPVYRQQQALLAQRLEMLVQIRVSARPAFRISFFALHLRSCRPS